MTKLAEELIKDLKKRKLKSEPIIKKFDPLTKGIPLQTLKGMTPNQIKKQLIGGRK